ncbi:iron complex outermembrane recepter protein [Sphingomonas guangdongensis]|uniref:Iron complex outermembrane recepter protein n=1 Tax=Sphingomonas guangdongensis TaxID=1141890 RepID=A0A285R2M0_9SPHN|nr:TonB-dependent receptor [Sphingomonas guangdongensis]SOB86607.1 iron complex outermembrane recepter protein [Sphingomonas guangdongensis]
MVSFKSFLLAGATTALITLATPATAQVAAGPDDTAATTDDGTLGEIVVTAERREENLQRTPVSVGVVSGEDLRRFQAGGDDTLSLAGRVPSLYAETTTGRIFPRYYIRGLGNIDFYLGASQPVTIIQDDVVLEHVVLKSNPVFDAAQVEVLRGPQGSLFGRNTTAGIIKFDTNRPSQELAGRVSASYGSFNSVNVDAGVGGPIVADKIAFRLSALYQHRDDWIDNSYTGASFDGTRGGEDALGGFDERDVRLQLLFTPTEDISINLSGHARNYDGTSTVFHRGALRRGSNNIQGEPRTRVALDEGDNNPQGYDTYGGSANASWDFGGVALTSITAYETTAGYSRGDTDGGAATLFTGPAFYGQSQGNIRDLDQWTQELRLASTGDTAFKWQVGGFYFDNRDITEFYQRRFFLTAPFVAANANTNNPGNFVRLRDVNTSWAVFGQASYRLDRLTLTAGGRYTEDRKRTTLVQPATTGATVNFPATAPRTVRLVGKEPSWDVSALYEVDPALSLYARVARGFRGPTIQGRSAVFGSAFTTADSETIISYEAGFKSQPTSRIRLNATAFGYRVDDIQLNGNDANGNGVLFNADNAEAYGAEAELEWRPIRNIAFSLGGSVLHTEINDPNVYAQVCALGGGVGVTCTVLDPTITRPIFGTPTVLAQIDGNPLPNAPKWQLNAAVRYDIPLSSGAKLFVDTDFNVQGYTNLVLYRTREFYADGNFELGLRAGLTSADGRYELAAFARNITAEKNLKGVIENYNAAVFNEPRIIGVSLSARY